MSLEPGGDWLLRTGGREVGPFTPFQLRAFLQREEIRADDPVTRFDAPGEWIKVAEIVEALESRGYANDEGGAVDVELTPAEAALIPSTLPAQPPPAAEGEATREIPREPRPPAFPGAASMARPGSSPSTNGGDSGASGIEARSARSSGILQRILARLPWRK